jgi:hypothetical protein
MPKGALSLAGTTPFPDVVHGCLLEGMALALEGRFEPYSQGRGFITPQRVEEIESIAARHGIYLAPLYNADGPVEDGLDCRTECSRGCGPASVETPLSLTIPISG